jgi:GH15 family glucan-1,4-alpha-glucosidase
VAWEGLPKVKCPQRLDAAFTHARTGHPNVDYVFPATVGKTYHVFLGVGRSEWLVGDPSYFKSLKLSVDGQSETFEFRKVSPSEPIFHEFVVKPSGAAIRVRSEGMDGGPLLSGIWIFENPAEPALVSAGKLNKQALFYVACGRERQEDIVTSIDLDFDASPHDSSTIWIQLPYSLQQSASDVSAEKALTAAKDRWRALVEGGAQFETGLPQFDNLYKTSLLNLFLLRTKHSGAGTDGQDIYVVKPGATIYDSFWFRDGAYIINAMDVAGLHEEAEKSTRLLTDPGLKDPLKEWGQQADGLWASPRGEWDSQGQALWTLVHHYEMTGDVKWLRRNYESIRRGAQWIKDAIARTKQLDAHGKRPVTYGLLPKGVSEDTGSSAWTYIYEHNFWVSFGLREAIKAAERLGNQDDVRWMRETDTEFSADLLASVKRAYDTVGGGTFIPSDPFDPELDINGDLAAVYPGRFLDPKDPMITGSLARIAQHSQEDLYTWFKTLNNGDMWTYMTVDWAMCCLLRDDLAQFYKLYKSYAAHASPTNGWPECIYVRSRLGTGDTPHGWAAASYVLMHRNAFVYENEADLELCWGVHPEWLVDGAHLSVKRAPTRFGKLDLDLRRAGEKLTFEHNLAPVAGQPKPREVRLHIPLGVRVQSILLNGSEHRVSPDERVIRIGS